MPTVKIAYDPDLSKIGTTRDVSDAEARDLVRAGRAVLADAAPQATPAKKAPAKKAAAKKQPAKKAPAKAAAEAPAVETAPAVPAGD